jgi:hypothetical protein
MFYTNMQRLCDQQHFDQRIAELQFHFRSCLHRKKAMLAFQQFRDLVGVNETVVDNTPLPSVSESKDINVTHFQFIGKLQNIMLDATSKLSKPLAALRAQQLKRQDFIRHQQKLYDEILDRFHRGDVESIEAEVEACRLICADLYPKLDNAKRSLSSHKSALLQKKIDLEQCTSSLNQLKDQESDLLGIIERNEALVASIKPFKKDVADYAIDIGVPKFQYCGSFLGQEKQSMLSDDSSSTINKGVTNVMESLDRAKEILSTESLEEVKSIGVIDSHESWAEHCQHIQKLQHNYKSAISIHATAQANQQCIVTLLQDLTLTQKQHCIVKELSEGYHNLISYCDVILKTSTSAFKVIGVFSLHCTIFVLLCFDSVIYVLNVIHNTELPPSF